jgi:hypothetical protein
MIDIFNEYYFHCSINIAWSFYLHFIYIKMKLLTPTNLDQSVKCILHKKVAIALNVNAWVKIL